MNKNQLAKRLISFKRHCEQEGYELLPDDYRFIDHILNILDISDFKAVLSHYLSEWSLGMADSQSACQSQNFGRRRANLWILRYCDEVREKKLRNESNQNQSV